MMDFPLSLPISAYPARRVLVARHPDGRMTAEVTLLTPQEFTAMSAFADARQAGRIIGGMEE